MLKIKKIYKNYGIRVILSDISFNVEREHKIALVGNNGTGKTTLLKIMAGILEPDKGSVDLQKNITVGYLSQEADFDEEETIADYLKKVSGLPFIRKAKIIMEGFGLGNISQERTFSSLSGGQKSKIMLTGILLKGVDLLLLDEPTNNLDIPALVWLESFLKKSKISCVAVSHDRRFLDKTMKKVFELDERTHSLRINGGTYSNYLTMKIKEAARLKMQYRLQQDKLRQMRRLVTDKREAAAAGAKWVGSDNDKFLRGFKRNRAGKSLKTAKVVERKISKIQKIDRPFEKEALKIKIDFEKNSGSLDIKLTDISARYKDGDFKIGPISLDVQHGDRLGIMGDNGVGKTTILKIITGEIKPDVGEISIGSGVKIGDVTQERKSLPDGEKLVEFFKTRSGFDYPETYSILSKFGLGGDQANEEISKLSPGEKTRLLFALFSALSVNTLILDEPTNHLDVEAEESLEELIVEYNGTVILVSHDRHFIEKIKLDKIFLMENGTLSNVASYQEYINAAEEKAGKLLQFIKF